MNGSGDNRPPVVTTDGEVQIVELWRESHVRILDAWLKDGADNETIARRVGRSRSQVARVLLAVRKSLEYDSYPAMALALARREVVYRVASQPRDEMSLEPARCRKGA